MSYIMHNKHMKAIEFIKKLMRKRKKVPKADVYKAVFYRFGYGQQAVNVYIGELVGCGFIKNSGKTLKLNEECKDEFADVDEEPKEAEE